MTRFTTRIELHHSSSQQDYNRLHSAMESTGFSRFITRSTDAQRYHLPSAEYNWEGNASVDDVLRAAESAASSTGKTYTVLVTESNGRRWSNLQPA